MLDFVRTDAVLFHRDKAGGLIDLLRKQLNQNPPKPIELQPLPLSEPLFFRSLGLSVEDLKFAVKVAKDLTSDRQPQETAPAMDMTQAALDKPLITLTESPRELVELST